MQWITIDDLISELGTSKLAELSGDGSEIVQSVVDDAISSATEEVKAYISMRYALEDSQIPILFRELTKKIAIYNLYLRKNREMIVPIEVANEKNEAVRLLEQIKTGDIKIEQREKPSKIIFYSGKRYFDETYLDEFRNYRE